MPAELTAVLPYGRSGASSRVRVLDWIGELGIDATVFDYGGLRNNRPGTLVRHPAAALRGEARSRFMVPAGGNVILSREATPFSAGGVESRILRRAGRGVYDFDDALFNDLGTGVRRLFAKARKCESAVLAADHVIAGNEYLADWAGARNAAVTLIPSCVRPADYVEKTTWDLGDPPRLVWLGSPSTEKFLLAIAGPLMHAHRTRGARLTLISHDVGATLGPLEPMVDRVEWGLASFASDLASGDLGISPLTDTPYARGKSAYKLLQYAASAMPVVGSPIGANALALERFHGIAPTTQDEWVDALCELLDEGASAREARGLAAREAVEEHYSFAAWAPTWKATVLGSR